MASTSTRKVSKVQPQSKPEPVVLPDSVGGVSSRISAATVKGWKVAQEKRDLGYSSRNGSAFVILSVRDGMSVRAIAEATGHSSTVVGRLLQAGKQTLAHGSTAEQAERTTYLLDQRFNGSADALGALLKVKDAEGLARMDSDAFHKSVEGLARDWSETPVEQRTEGKTGKRAARPSTAVKPTLASRITDVRDEAEALSKVESPSDPATVTADMLDQVRQARAYLATVETMLDACLQVAAKAPAKATRAPRGRKALKAAEATPEQVAS